MRRVGILLILICVAAAMAIPVLAAGNACRIVISANVSTDESCHVTASVTLPAGQSASEFPIPKEAVDVTLSGERTSTHTTEQAQIVDVSRAGTAFTVSYTLPDVVHIGSAETPELQMPLLSGFVLPSELEFTVKLPQTVTAKPAFSSGYHHADIEKSLTFTTDGNLVEGSSAEELKDHETLTMTLDVEQAWFPDAPLEFLGSDIEEIAMGICGALALLYWLIFMRAIPPRRQHSATAPEGITAGQLGAVLTLGTADLSLMVFSWAQQGYLHLQQSRHGVTVSKIMDMGNERSAFEQRVFQKLFKKKTVVDTGSLHYAQLYKAVSKLSPNLQATVKPHSGNPGIFRALAALCSLFGGVSFAIALAEGGSLQGLWIVILGTVGLFCGWLMQEPLRELFLRKSHRTVSGLIAAVVWLLLGLSANQLLTAVVVLLAQWLTGFMTFYGGRRTATGRQDFAQIMGLRKYLKTLSKEELRRIQAIDPEYFHGLIPNALALGVGRGFAWHFGKEPIADCPYITTGKEKARTAWEWVDLMSNMLSAMSRRSRLLPVEKLLALLAPAKKS